MDSSELVYRRIAIMPMRLVASPAYLARHGEPKHPAALDDHSAILTRTDLDQWQLGNEVIRPRWNMSTGSMLVTRDAVLRGMGIGVLPAFLADPAIDEGRLVSLLPGHSLHGGEVNALWPRTQIPSLAVTTLVSYLMRPDLQPHGG